MAYKCHFRCPECGGINRVPSTRLDAEPVCGRCRDPLDVTGAPIELDDDQLDRLIEKSPVPILVEFYTDWSRPSKLLAPTLERVGKEYTGLVFVVRIDMEKHDRKSTLLDVTAVPTMVLFNHQRIVGKRKGARSYDDLERLLERHVEKYGPSA